MINTDLTTINLVDELQKVAPDKKLSILKSYLAALISDVLSLKSHETLNEKAGFFDLGMNSIKAVELKSRLQASIGEEITIPLTLIFDHPTLQALSKKIADLLNITIATPDLVETSIYSEAYDKLTLEELIRKIDNESE